MARDRTALAVKYAPGDRVWVHHTTGGSLTNPVMGLVLKRLETSSIYTYEVAMGDQGLTRKFNVREQWICPADICIDEVPDTPWD
jgi:hypothetical protein